MLERSLVESDPEIAEIMVSTTMSTGAVPLADFFFQRKKRSNANASPSSSSLPKM